MDEDDIGNEEGELEAMLIIGETVALKAQEWTRGLINLNGEMSGP